MQTLFNDGWKFSKIKTNNKDDEDGKPVLLSPKDFYASAPDDFADVSIPHDWLIYDTTNLYESSVGFYKKTFDFSQKDEEEYYLRFEGIYQNWACYVNGKAAFEWKYGYSTVEFCITNLLKTGNNIIEIIAVYQSPNSRWYSGAGIFRDVYFIKTLKTRIAPDGVYFSAKKIGTTSGDAQWQVKIETEIRVKNPTQKKNPCFCVKHTLYSNGNAIKIENPTEAIKKDGFIHVLCGEVQNPEIWDTENPALYKLKTELFSQNGDLLHSVEQNVGFRTINFTPDKGFFLNGRHIVLHGACEHHDFGLLGAAFNLTALKRKLAKLKSMGVNAIRCAHNPPAPALLDLADREGILIIDECFDMWEMPKTKYDYGNYFKEFSLQDCALWVKRDRNHPCIILWSIGNEIFDTNFESGIRITTELKKTVRQYDPYKNAFVTSASNHMGNENPQKCAQLLDVVGYNYAERLYDEHHKKNPSWCIYGSETGSHLQSRGVYHFPYNARPLTHQDNQCSALGNTSVSWGARDAEFTTAQDWQKSYTAGQFLWTGFDYIGEPTPYTTKNSYFGQIDTAGFEKDSFYIYKAAWVSAEKEPFVHVFPYWNWNEGQKVDMRCCTNAYSAELFVNGKTAGLKTAEANPFGKLISATWEGVEYHRGSISVVAYDKNKKEIAMEEKKSFGDSKYIDVNVETASENALFFIDIFTRDEGDICVENACDKIKIFVSGAARLLGADNGDSTDYEQYRSKDGATLERRLFNNRLLAMVKAASLESDFEIDIQSTNLVGKKLVFRKNQLAEIKELEKHIQNKNDFIPIRKIKLTANEELVFSKEKKTATVKAVIYPQNASYEQLEWNVRLARGIPSENAAITAKKHGNGEIAQVNALRDGEFIIVCSAKNRTQYPKVISEIECKAEGIGFAELNPYDFIFAAKCSQSRYPVELSFDNGIKTGSANSWFLFENVDFGDDGSDSFSLMLYSPSDNVRFSAWNGNPDEGKKLGDFYYSAKSKYEVYQKNNFTLDERLFGLQKISFEFYSELSFKGFEFEKTKKAFSKLRALDATCITGDSFIKTEVAVEKIGNNISLDFENMDFGNCGAGRIIICGRAKVDNNIQIVINSKNEAIRHTLNFPATPVYDEKDFILPKIAGPATVSFIFLPGSHFDFKWFKFTPARE